MCPLYNRQHRCQLENESNCKTADLSFRLTSVSPVVRCETATFIVKLHPSFTEIVCQVYRHHGCIIHTGILDILLLEQSHDVDCLREHEFNLQVSFSISSSNAVDSKFHVVDISGQQSANLMSKHCRISNYRFLQLSDSNCLKGLAIVTGSKLLLNEFAVIQHGSV